MTTTLSKDVQIDKIFAIVSALIPNNTLISVSEWAELNRYLDSKASGRSGLFDFDNAPYCREIADRFSKNDPTQEVAIMKGVQLGLTTSVIENIIGYSLDLDPCPMMFVFPNKDQAEEYKKIKIDGLIDNSNLRSRITAETDNKNSRRTGDTAALIEFKGGFLKFVSANNPKELRSTHIKKALLDELDGYPDKVGQEGDPIQIVTSRTDSYSELGRKICYNSTPALKHNSKIYAYFLKGDQRKFYVPCPICGEMQELVFYQADGGLYSDERAVVKGKNQTKTKPYGVMFNAEQCQSGDYSSVCYRCKHCGGEFKDHFKRSIEQKGEWRPTAHSKVPLFTSYHISALYSQTRPWWRIVQRFIEAGKDPQKLQVFYNLDLGLPFEQREGNIEYQQVHRLRDDRRNKNIVPKEALFMTCAADVQHNRIEAEIKAYGDRFRCWGIDHRVFYGNPMDIYDSCWQQFRAIKDEVFTDGRKVDIQLVDSGDGETQSAVYDFCETFGDGVIMPLKGLRVTERTKEKVRVSEIKDYRMISLVEIYVDLYKNTLARYFSQEEPLNDSYYPDGWHTFANSYTDEYFRQLSTEQRVKVVTPGGGIKIQWKQHGRNEAFDLNVYNLAAADLFIKNFSIYVLGLEYTDPKRVFDYLKAIRGLTASN
jgi:phage terminase large subunit GpA-like protein